ncbi:hypothetical protein DL765_006518 [Monosporascus sp. GIB2]|nr:hypothetical protein DL765_006518 [Monosporascus sp. GIB2]
MSSVALFERLAGSWGLLTEAEDPSFWHGLNNPLREHSGRPGGPLNVPARSFNGEASGKGAQLTMASEQLIPGQLPAKQSGLSEPPFPSPQQGPSHDRSVPQDKEYYMDRLEDAIIQLLDVFQRQKTRSSKSSRSTSVQPKALKSAPPEVKAGGSKEVPVVLESDVEEINLLREGEKKPRRWSTKKPNPLDPPKRQKSKPPKGVARSDPDNSDSSSSDSSGGPPKKKKNRHSSPSNGSSSSDSSSESGLGLKDFKKSSDKDSKLR